MTEPLTPEAEAFHEWLCRTARFSPTGTWGTVARNTLATLDVDRLALKAALAIAARPSDETGAWDDFAAWLRMRGIDHDDRRAIADYVGEHFAANQPEPTRGADRWPHIDAYAATPTPEGTEGP